MNSRINFSTLAVPLLIIWLFIQGCTQNTRLLRNGNPEPKLTSGNYQFPNFKKSGHTPPDSVVAFVAGKIKYKSRFYRDSNGNVLKTIRYDENNKVLKTSGNHVMRDESKLFKSIAYSCKREVCKESGVLEQYYVENQSSD